MDKQHQLKELGHELEVFKSLSGRRFIVQCSCGYGGWQQRTETVDGVLVVTSTDQPSVTRATFAEAVRTANWHADRVLAATTQEARRNGRVLRRTVAS